MNRKRIVLFDGSGMLRDAFYRLPSDAADGIRNLIINIIEGKEADYFGVAFGTRVEDEPQRPQGLIKQEERLLEIVKTQNLPVFVMEDYDSVNILASMAKKCQSEDGEVTVFTGDRRLLQIADEHITIKIPGENEGRIEFQSYSPEVIRERYALEPLALKDVFSLLDSGKIGERTACGLIGKFGSLSELYNHIEEVDSIGIREALNSLEDLKKGEGRGLLREDCPLSFDYSRSLSEIETEAIMNMEFEPAEFPEETFEEASETFTIHSITDFSEAEAVFNKCEAGAELGIQLIIEHKMVTAMSVCLGEDENYCFIPQGFLTAEYLSGKAEEISKRAGKVTTIHLKEQLSVLKLLPDSPAFDAGVAGYLLNPLGDSYEYNDLAREYLNIELPSKVDYIGKGSFCQALEDNREEAVSCICSMSYVAWKIGPILRKRLEEEGMDTLFNEIEMPLIYSLFYMEEAGIQVEKERLKEYGDRLKIGIAELEQKIYKETGETFNINSPKQLGEVLFEHMKIPGGKKTKTGYSTAADVLEKLSADYPVVERILDYRQLTKLNSTYADGLAAYIGPDGRIHGTFNQTITATGRISSTEPNLQNIPVRMELGREIRKVFVPKEGCVFVDADYSQIELRVLAHMSGDSRLINAYRQAEDIHAITASEVFHVPLMEVTSLQRRNAKAVNFGIVYGISSFGLSEGLSITRKEAGEYIDKYFETYPGVKAFLDGLVTEAKEKGYAVSMFGRRRPVPELKSSNFMQRSFGERVAMNSPIQGTAADIMKIAMVRVDRALRTQGLKSRIVLQVHDELLIEAYREELSAVKELLVEEMKHAASLQVSLEVEANVGESWFDAK